MNAKKYLDNILKNMINFGIGPATRKNNLGIQSNQRIIMENKPTILCLNNLFRWSNITENELKIKLLPLSYPGGSQKERLYTKIPSLNTSSISYRTPWEFQDSFLFIKIIKWCI